MPQLTEEQAISQAWKRRMNDLDCELCQWFEASRQGSKPPGTLMEGRQLVHLMEMIRRHRTRHHTEVPRQLP